MFFNGYKWEPMEGGGVLTPNASSLAFLRALIAFQTTLTLL
jgi:hypothetical protein